MFLAAIAAMPIAPVPSTPISTFAWYSATAQASITANETENIVTQKEATLEGVTIVAHYWKCDADGSNAHEIGTVIPASDPEETYAFNPVELSGTDGITKLWTGQTAVPAANQASLTKIGYGYVTFTWTSGTVNALAGKTIDVTISGNGQLRVGAETSDVNGKYVGDSTSTTGSFTVAATPGTAPSAYTTSAVDLNGGTANDGIYFCYSVSPDNPELDTKSAGAVYGQLSIAAEVHTA